MTGDVRLFIGIEIGAAWTERLAALADQPGEPLGRAVRWVRPELYHVTVSFLGNRPHEAPAEIEAALIEAAATVEPFDLRLTELLRFGAHERGALVAGVDDPTGRLQILRHRLDVAFRTRRLDFDARKLTPHVTLGRPRGRSGPIPFPPTDLRDAPPLDVRTAHLVKSMLLPTGPQYETLASVDLGAQRISVPLPSSS